MKVYHGSYTKIYDIDLSKCEPKKDFGQGFYVTKFREQAEFWAVRKGIRNRSDCVITEFEFNEDAYHDRDSRLLRFEGYDENWFDFVIQNRYDIVFNIEDIGAQIVETLIIDMGKSTKDASDIFFSSATFGNLSDISTRLYEKPWQEIYEMLKKELNLS